MFFSEVLTNKFGSEFYLCRLCSDAFESVGDIEMKLMQEKIKVRLIGVVEEGKNILNPDRELRVRRDQSLILLADDLKTLEGLDFVEY